jgi:chaperonin GroEL (HSP60 family)
LSRRAGNIYIWIDFPQHISMSLFVSILTTLISLTIQTLLTLLTLTSKTLSKKNAHIYKIKISEESLVASIVLRSSVVSVINDLERACEDGLSTVQHCCSHGQFLPGGGAFEMEMASRLRKLANETDSLDQYAIRKVTFQEGGGG